MVLTHTKGYREVGEPSEGRHIQTKETQQEILTMHSWRWTFTGTGKKTQGQEVQIRYRYNRDKDKIRSSKYYMKSPKVTA